MALSLEYGKNRALAGWPMILGWLAMLIFALHACTHMVAAGDTWVALASGRHFINHGVSTVEPFSANSHKPGPTPQEIKTWPDWAQWITDKVGLETVKYWHPTGWVNQNWLTHVIFYWLTTLSPFADAESLSFNTLVYWKVALYVLSVICVYYTGVVLGVNPALSAVFASFSMFVARSFLDIRPQGFSNFLVTVFLLVLVLAAYRNILYIWLIVPLAVFWCNLHGGYVYLFIMLVPFIFIHFITGFFPKKLVSVGRKGLLHSIAVGFVAFLAVIIFNPFHLTNLTHTFVISISKHAELWRTVNEWHPAFEWENPVGDEMPFLAMYIIALRALVVWVIALILTGRLIVPYLTKRKGKIYGQYQSGGIDSLPVIIAVAVMLGLTGAEWFLVNSAGKDIPLPANPIISWSLLAVWWIFWIALVVWIFLVTRFVGRNFSKPKVDIAGEFEPPRIDLALMVIAALTIYMAIRSRRFIPIGAVVACPVIAMLIDQTVRAVSAAYNFRKHNRLAVPSMPYKVQVFFVIAGFAVVSTLGILWGLKFKRIYLDPWPTDPKLTSIFMRMSASDAKPFYACQFIRENKLSGKMFNYWTEGGFIAWGQDPDPNTGETPLKLFMDGRAQAAYEPDAYLTWSNIMAGGPIVKNASARGHSLTAKDYIEVGKWVEQELKKRNVWVALMPSGQFTSPFVRGLEVNSDWNSVFYEDKQKLFVDMSSPQGSRLFQGILTGKTVFPDKFYDNLMKGRILLLAGKDAAARQKGLALLIEAVGLNPSQSPMKEITEAAGFPELEPLVNDFCKKYTDNFMENKNLYAGQDGFLLKLWSALIAVDYLRGLAEKQKNPELAKFYTEKRSEYFKEQKPLVDEKRW